MNGKSQLMTDSLAWLGNVSTSVAIIFVNKVLMNVSGFGFRYGARDSAECIAKPRFAKRACTPPKLGAPDAADSPISLSHVP